MAHRSFRDEHGREWDAWEVVPTTVERRVARDLQLAPMPGDRRKVKESRVVVPDALQKGWLAFQSGSERRRLAPIPPNWMEMTSEELVELLKQSGKRGRARRLIE
jgi:hypothetical protein